MKSKIIVLLILFILIINVVISYANLEDLETYSLVDLNQEIQDASSNISGLPEINSRSAIVFDRISHCILFGKSEHEQRKMASTTKIMTAIIVIEQSNLYDTVIISKKASNTGGSRLGINENDKITVCDLLYGLLLKSR